MGTFTVVAPHGGRLVNRVPPEAERATGREKLAGKKALTLGPREVSDLLMLGVGAFSPLEGFLTSADYHAVVRDGRLSAGLPWTIPIVLPVSAETAKSISVGEDVGLRSADGRLLGALEVRDKFRYDKEAQARQVFGTTERQHPAVDYLFTCGEVLVGGPVTLLELPPMDACYQNFHLQPRETRYLFQQKGWRTVVGFQTRNPVHRAHEYIQKCALETVDGLLLHPLVGETKSDDIPAPVRMECYRALLDHYYPKDRVVLSVFPAAMRYGGPREAIFHALVRKNYGCTHFIVGRDHAGVGDYYGPYDAQHIFGRYAADEIGITPMFFDFTFYCRRCGHIVSEKTCRHADSDRLSFSGTKVREMLARGESLPDQFTRPEIARILSAASQRHQL